jgi:aminoglycoside 6'-N-acetyltransferase
MELPVLRGERVTLRPLTDADLDELTAIVQSPTVREWWPSVADAERVREELRSDGSTYWTFTTEVEGRRAGWLGFSEEDDPYYRHASLDVILSEEHQGRGLGPEALRTAIDWLTTKRGHHRFTIDPAVGNRRAIRAYEAVGFRPVGVLRRHERGPDGAWRDSLLMDLLADELPARY